jgi:hypothetical protein
MAEPGYLVAEIGRYMSLPLSYENASALCLKLVRPISSSTVGLSIALDKARCCDFPAHDGRHRRYLRALIMTSVCGCTPEVVRTGSLLDESQLAAQVNLGFNTATEAMLVLPGATAYS